MQFVGKSGIALFVVVISGSVAAGFGSGLLVGRQFPTHHFERFGTSTYLLDPTTGKVCDPLKDPKADPFAQYIVDPTTGKMPAEVSGGERDQNGFLIVKPAYPPPCGG